MSAPVIGIDLRPTKVAVAPLRDGRLAESRVQPTERSQTAALIDQLAAMVESARTDDLRGVGIGVPRIVEFETGRVVSTSRPASPVTNGAVDVPLADVPLRQVLEERLGVPVFVDNDANVAALAEAHDEELELVVRHLVMLTVGMGVAGGLVLGGRIYRGASGAAGELGHTILGLDLAGAVPSPDGLPATWLARLRGLRSCARSACNRGRQGAPRVRACSFSGGRQAGLGRRRDRGRPGRR
jgi:glucokinase